MEYQALYRKYRPKNFDEVAGQNITLKILKNAIINDKIAHAYLFYGPRGTGKTSIAKIFARVVNCDDQHDGIQCEKCEKCLISKEKECVDIIEIDAASNNSVDEIRELKNKVAFVPSELKYKVYIIDEVHMLSIGAFNALLKTLEEPPKHVIFILATTELNKVPATIISRCQTLEFKKINNKDMFKKIKEISTKENIKIDDKAIEEISRCSNGGLRDAIGLLEKVNSYANGNIDCDAVKEVSGNIPVEELEEFIKEFESKSVDLLIKKINKYYDEGIDLIKLTNELIEYENRKIIDNKMYNSYECTIVKKLDNLLDILKKSDNQKIMFEITLLDMLLDEPQNNSINNKNIKLASNKEEKVLVEEEKVLPKDNENKNDFHSDIKKIRVSNTLCNPQKNIISNIRNNWGEIKNLAFDKNYGNIARLLSSDILPVAASEENVIIISKLIGISEQINSDLYSVEKIFEKVFNKSYRVICITEKEWNEYIDLYKKDKTNFKYIEEKNIDYGKKTLKDKAKALFEDI